MNYPYSLGSAGSITGSSAGSAYYYFLYNWQIEQEAVMVESARIPVVAEVVNGVVLNAKVLLEGAFDENAGMMSDALRVSGLIPLNEPYADLGFPQVGGGGEVIAANMLIPTGASAIVDWVRVELRDATTPSTVVAVQSALVTRSGDLVSVTGSPLRFNVNNGSYHVAVRHRNHLGVMTASPVAIECDTFRAGLHSRKYGYLGHRGPEDHWRIQNPLVRRGGSRWFVDVYRNRE